MLKITAILEKLTFDILNIRDGKDSIGVNNNRIKHIKKSGKSNAQKLFKSQKLAKSRNLPNFDAKKTG